VEKTNRRTGKLLGLGVLMALVFLVAGTARAQCPSSWTLQTYDFNGTVYPGSGGSAVVGGTTINFTNNAAYSAGTPAVTSAIQGGTGGNTLQLQHNGSATPATFTMAFGNTSNTVLGLSFTLIDVDCLGAGGSGGTCATSAWRDQVTVTSSSASPLTLTPTPATNSVAGNVATGNENAGNNTAAGNVGVAFSANVADVTLSFANAPGAGTANHGIAIRSVSFCEPTPTHALISDVSSSTAAGSSTLEWSTASEIEALGFHVLRRDDETREFHRVNQQMIPALQTANGGTYRFVDDGAERGRRYTYKIVEVTLQGNHEEYGPFQPHASRSTASPRERAELRENGFWSAPHALNAFPPKDRTALRAPAESAAGRPGVAKLGVREDGLYFVTTGEMASWMNVPESQVRSLLQNRQLSLQNLGQDVAYYPAPDQSGLYFYGQKPASSYTKDNVYWLQQSRLFRGTVMGVVSGGSPTSSSTATSFTDFQKREENKIALTSMEADPASDFWYWDYVGGAGSKTFSLGLENPAAGNDMATLRIVGRGTTTEEHPLKVTVNGFVIGEATPVGTARFSVELPVAQSALVRGANDVTVTRTPRDGASEGGVFIDSFELVYQRQNRASGDSLTILGETNSVLTVGGFTKSDVRVLDVSNARMPAWVSGVTVAGSGDFSASFVPAGPDSRYFLASSAALRKPAWATNATQSNLRDASNDAQYLVIAPAAFEPAAQALAAYRSALRSRVVILEDIYDEFSYGLATPEAIRAFLAHAAATWSSKPRYVALLGNGTFDYRDDWGKGDNFLPPMLVNTTPGGLFASDNALADVDGDGVPDLAIGRIPILSNEQGFAYVRKVTAHEKSSGSWTSRALLVADLPDSINYKAQSDVVAGLLPAGYQKSTVYLTDHAIGEARQLFASSLASGVGLVNYMGHGGTDRMAKSGILTLEDVPSLVNRDRFPVLSALTCVLNRYEYPAYASLGELLTLKEDGGAIAVWSSTGYSFPEAAEPLNETLFKAYQTGRQPVGDAILSALRQYAAQGHTANHLRTYTLIGDPAALTTTP